jgi:hypothetical protein
MLGLKLLAHECCCPTARRAELTTGLNLSRGRTALDDVVTMLIEKALGVIREEVELLHAAFFGFGFYSGEEGGTEAVAAVRGGNAD